MECGELSPLLRRRLVAVEQTGPRSFSEPLDAALPGRQAGQAVKAATNRRTPNLCRKSENLHNSNTDGHEYGEFSSV
jgi:hypothetical protein